MKNEMSGIRDVKGKAGLAAATLPRWARFLIAKHTEAAFPGSLPHFINHCFDCGCVLISTNIAYEYDFDRCPECSTKKRTSQGGN